jgi:hypothetical protein
MCGPNLSRKYDFFAQSRFAWRLSLSFDGVDRFDMNFVNVTEVLLHFLWQDLFCGTFRGRSFSTNKSTKGEFQMIDRREDVELVNDIVEIQELESKVSPNIVWST